jgi:DNA polymerase-1
VRDLIAVRDAAKVLEYAQNLAVYLDLNGRVHSVFDCVGAATGRLSSKEPNLQNCPKTPLGKLIRLCFRPGLDDDGYFWEVVQLDYSQIELRIGAELSQDPNMIEIFHSGVDYHLRTAQRVAESFGEDPSLITKDSIKRQNAKKVNFGLMYGMGDAALAHEIGVTTPEAAELREAILGSVFVKLGTWMTGMVRTAAKTGYVPTYYAGEVMRERDLTEIALPRDDFGGMVSNATNAAKNTPVQGSANYLNLMAAVGVVDWILAEHIPAKLVNLVHDSMVLEVRSDWSERVARKVREIMLQQPVVSVPLAVDVERGPSWAELERWDLK